MRTEMIGPERAKSLLSINKTNRNISERHVKEYAKMMANGDWDFTPQGITISKTGSLIDGQHRLNAIIKSGVTIKACVFIIDEHDTAMGVMIDRGKTRSTMDITGIPKDSVAIANFILRNIVDPGQSLISPYDTERFYQEHLKAFAWYEENVIQTHIRKLTNASIRSALLIRHMNNNYWLDQYLALIHLDFNGMCPGTQTLYRYTLNNSWHVDNRVSTFSLAYKVSSTEGRKISRIPPVITIGDAKEVVLSDIGK
jgi:hypothetical protein